MIAGILISLILLAKLFAAPDFDLKEEKRVSEECLTCKVVHQTAIKLFGQYSYLLLPELGYYCFFLTNEDAHKLCLEFAIKHDDSYLELVAAMTDTDKFCSSAVSFCRKQFIE